MLKKNMKGFSLIEVVLSVALLAVITIAFVPIFNYSISSTLNDGVTRNKIFEINSKMEMLNTLDSVSANPSNSTIQAENMTKSGQYTANISSPFTGVAIYGNNDAVSTSASFSGSASITCRGASNNSNTAFVSLYIGSSKVGTFTFNGTSAQEKTIYFSASGTQTVRLVLENDTGIWDAFIDYISIGGASSIDSTIQAETMTKSGQYTGNISSPFSGVALYGNNDAVSTSTSFSGNTSITCRGASNNSQTADVSLYIGSSKVGTFSFSGTSIQNETISFSASGTQTVRLVLENDSGIWDAFIDYISIDNVSSSNTNTNIETLFGSSVTITTDPNQLYISTGNGNFRLYRTPATPIANCDGYNITLVLFYNNTEYVSLTSFFKDKKSGGV